MICFFDIDAWCAGHKGKRAEFHACVWSVDRWSAVSHFVVKVNSSPNKLEPALRMLIVVEQVG